MDWDKILWDETIQSRVGQNLEIQEDKCKGLQKIWDKTGQGQEFCRDMV